MAPAPENSTIGIKRPEYLVEEGCAERIYRHFPNCKLIAVLRNPVDRAFSAYLHLMSIGYIPVLKPDEAFGKLLNGTLQVAYPKSETILSYGRYCQGVRTYLHYFGPDKLLFLLHDEINANPREVLQSIYSFVDVDPEYVSTNEIQQRPRASVNSLIRQRVIRFASRQMHNFSPDGLSYGIKPDPTILNRLASRMAYTFDKKILKYVCSNQKNLLSPVTAQALYAYFEDQINELEELLQLNLSKWRKPKERI